MGHANACACIRFRRGTCAHDACVHVHVGFGKEGRGGRHGDYGQTTAAAAVLPLCAWVPAATVPNPTPHAVQLWHSAYAGTAAQVTAGMDVVRKLEALGDDDGTPSKPARIKACGELPVL